MGLRSFAKKAIPLRHPVRSFYHRTRGVAAALKAGLPQQKLRIIGVTGTDGKTTTVGMTAHILRSAGKTVGASSTTFFRINDDVRWNETHKTSVDPSLFQKFLNDCVAAGCDFAVVEASSHGLVQGRLGPIRPEVAAITNVSLEHLDFHGTMQQYRKDKSILFKRLKRGGSKVINADDESAELLLGVHSGSTVLYSTEEMPPSDDPTATLLWTSDVKVHPGGTSAIVHLRRGDSDLAKPLELTIPGAYNLENALAAIGSVLSAGIDLETAVKALRTFAGIPGRLERIEEGQPFSVFVDFTVTPLAYERALSTIRDMHPGKRLLVLTGACGDRMKEKRPEIGAICSRIADVVVVTTDETVHEDPLKVIDDVWSGVNIKECEAKKIPDRTEAIRWLLQSAKPGDAVMLCGMGACQTMQTRSGLIPWDEREVARRLLRELQ